MKRSLMIATMLGFASLAPASDWTDSFKVAAATPKAIAQPTALVTPSETPVVVTPSPVAILPSSVQITGYVDVFGSFNATSPNASTNGAHLGTAQITFQNSQSSTGTGEYVELIFGENAGAFTSANATSGSATAGLKQAYITQSYGKYTLEAGKFIGFLGYELPDPNNNLNYNRSKLFFSEPVYNIGAVIKYAATDTLTLLGYGVNENSSDISLDQTRDAGASLQWLGQTQGFAFNFYRDNFQTSAGQGHNDLLNAYAYYGLTDSLTVAAEGLQVGSLLNAGAFYVSYTQGAYSLSPRFVVANDNTKQYTLTGKYKHGNATETLEAVVNTSPNQIFNDANSSEYNFYISHVYTF